MRLDRLFTTVLVATLVAVAGFAGGVTAGAPAGDTVSQQETDSETVDSVEISEMTVENFSTEMELDGATLVVETADGTEEVTVESATVTVEDATVIVENATLENGSLNLESADVTITDGQVEIESSHGDRSIDLSNTDESVESVSIELDEFADEEIDMREDLNDVTIRELTVDGISGESEVGIVVANMQVEGERETENHSVSIQEGNLSVQDATVELENATIEDGMLMVESVNTSVASAEVNADRVVVLRGLALTEHNNVQQSVEDVQFSHQNVEIDIEEWSEMLEQLVGSQAATEAES